MITDVGQILVNDALPADMQDYTRVLDRKGIRALSRELYDKHPDDYRDIMQNIMTVGRKAAHSSGSSLSLRDLRKAKSAKKHISDLQRKIDRITESKLPPEQKDQKIVELLGGAISSVKSEIQREGLEEDNAFSLQVLSGSRGNESQLGSLRGGDLMVLDHKDRPVPIPIVHSYSEGIDPVEFWASSYGSRKGSIGKKFAVADAGFLAKQLNNAAHKLVATDDEPLEGTGLPVDPDDKDNIGAVLAADYAGFKAGTIITPSIHNKLKRLKSKILVHSPVASIVNRMGGVPRKAAGIREYGRLAAAGENLGMPAAQSLSEKLSQAQLSLKHTAGVAGGEAPAAGQSGFKAINQLAQVPKTFAGRATLAQLDGHVRKIEPAPQGGHFIYIGNEQHYVPQDRELKVKVGDELEAGDSLSSGIPNPAEIVHYKGVGEGRRNLVYALRDVLANSGVNTNRRNLELVARGLVNHVRITDPDGVGDWLPDDVIEYDTLAARYTPREGYKTVSPKMARGMYLEKPALHYTIGTRITPRVVKQLEEFKVPNVAVHTEEPQFQPEQHRAMDALFYSDDWMTSLGGFSISKILQRNVHRGAASTPNSFSYIPGLAEGKDFGKKPNTPY